MPCYIPEERRLQLHLGGSLESGYRKHKEQNIFVHWSQMKAQYHVGITVQNSPAIGMSECKPLQTTRRRHYSQTNIVYIEHNHSTGKEIYLYKYNSKI